MSFEVFRETALRCMEYLAAGKYVELVAASKESRLSAEDLRHCVELYGRTVTVPPTIPDDCLDVIEVTAADCPTWSVWFPLWTEEEGRSDLALQLAISLDKNIAEFEIDNLRVL